MAYGQECKYHDYILCEILFYFSCVGITHYIIYLQNLIDYIGHEILEIHANCTLNLFLRVFGTELYNQNIDNTKLFSILPETSVNFLILNRTSSQLFAHVIINKFR